LVWRENWIVFAQDFSGDPVFVDINLANTPVVELHETVAE
jgi:hypothetical protein